MRAALYAAGIIFFLVLPSGARTESGTASGGDTKNETLFHRSPGSCPQCHANPVSFATAAPGGNNIKAKQLVGGPDALCLGCHPEAHPGHGTGLKPSVNKLGLPLDEQGRMVCAYTCHNVHPAETDPDRKRMLRHDTDSLCLSCHPK